jgi:type IV secretory pathway VirB4 component
VSDRDLGALILPQPKAKETYVPIPKIRKTIPFGYRQDEENPDLLQPIPTELEALELAKKHLKQYSSRQVAAWLTTTTGRTISHVGLLKRIKTERKHGFKSATYRNLATRLKKALEQAERYEEKSKRLGREDPTGYFESEQYSKLTEYIDSKLARDSSSDT